VLVFFAISELLFFPFPSVHAFLCALCVLCGKYIFFYLNFNDPIEISARMIPMIQNRTMTFDSGHPICSKW
jgi:hypothetical protein